MTKKGKNRTRLARHDILRSNQKIAAKKAKQNRQAYDGHRTDSEDPLLVFRIVQPSGRVNAVVINPALIAIGT